MSKLHVKHIEGYITTHLKDVVYMGDYLSHVDSAQYQKAFLSRGLSVLAVSHLSEAPLNEVGNFVTDGSKDGGIDLIYFDAKERTLYLAQTKWHSDGHGSIELGDALKFIEGVRKVLDNDLEGLNDRIKARKTDIESALYDANAKFALVIAHTGQESLNVDVSAVINDYVESQNDTSELMSVRVLAQTDLHKAVATGVAGTPISIEVHITAWGQVREPHFAIYGQISAADVSAWLQTHGSRLFDSNLRHFIGSSVVNQDIVKTLIDRPQDFWYFNNGITAISSDVAKKPLGGNSTEFGIFECSGFSVVNGAQTVGSIHAAALQNLEAVSKAMVPLRIISSSKSEETFGSEVTRFTNTQNAIEKRDFVALDPEQERIRQELHIEGVEYTYKTGSGSGASGQRFDLAEATVALACSHQDVALAVQAKREIGKLWDDISKAPYKQLFNKALTGPALWEVVQALRAVDEELQKESKNYTGRESLICVHGNRFIQWSILMAIGMKHGESFAKFSSAVPEVTKGVISQVIAKVKLNNPESYPASLFKNLAKCRALSEN